MDKVLLMFLVMNIFEFNRYEVICYYYNVYIKYVYDFIIFYLNGGCLFI